MNTQLSNAQTAVDYPPPVSSDMYLTAPADISSYNYTSWVVPKIINDPVIPFVSALAHELRNPLSNINLSVELLASVIKDEDLLQYLDIIARNSMRINGLVNELLKYQQADDMKTERYFMHELIDEALQVAGDRIKLKNITVRKDYTGNDCKITLNRSRMKIALTNIILNAVDAMSRENGELRLITKSVGELFVIEIGDNGCGISKGNLKNIFKPYFTDKPGGLGLGLATTRDILRSNHVGINVESEKNKGTRFILLFQKNPLV